ncbi:hypothetical protein RII68_000905 [Vibrio parahaemolyticus]|jgi:hypothetical protein|uniref:hypothetical protein n=1 Tax=Vibrio harveyi group TaxID=717610 RepID=UPI00084B2826|nr:MULTISPECIES: hypothetical protein [Vibrio harveyi group]EGR1768077.1 hypothetical protein [Vibrio parahaemolyticus]EGR2270314.1 hypothetical protein [Vibrio parahaemolyticus]EJC7016311.1 hypothetical protein [Vibrio parahaemolyticus]EJI1373728.1 hypothetical protein [Vibrio parahaemolyticus]ELC0704544.1 hypothetical protein [Vibrio parahaemolyticus]
MKNISVIDDNGILNLPDNLSSLYISKLESIGYLEYAKEYHRNANTEGPIGGSEQADTYEHFAARFSNSCARLQYVVINPKDEFGTVPDNFISSFSSGKLCLLDAPCGTGAASMSLLHLLCTARKEGRLPKLPLSVHILAADYSEHALKIFTDLLNKSQDEFVKNAIQVTTEEHLWDAKDVASTAQLMDDFRSHDCDEFFVIVSAFSGLGPDGLEEIKPSLQHIQTSLSNKKFTLVHIEPQTKKAKSFLKDMVSLIQMLFKEKEDNPRYESRERFIWLDPVNGREIKSDVMISLNCRG